MALCAMTLFSPAGAWAQSSPKRIVAMSGTVAEILIALGKTDDIVATCISSTYPEAVVDRIPKAGFLRQIAAEGVLSFAPDMLITTAEAGPPPALDQLRSAGVAVKIVQLDGSVAATKAAIREIGQWVHAAAKAEALVQALEQDIRLLEKMLQGVQSPPRVLFVYARGQGVIMAGGRETGADHMIRLAGGENAITAFRGYKTLSPEAVVAADPQLILMRDKGLESLGGIEGVLRLPGIAATTAGKKRNIVSLDDLYLAGYGPRMGKAALDLARMLYPGLTSAQK